MELTIVDYGLGNLRSLSRGLERAGGAVIVTDDAEAIAAADAVVLPGVGAFREGMRGSRELHDALERAAETKPVLGVCLGMQMLLSESEEGAEGGTTEGLDLVPGRVVRFPDGVGKVPHMGWNTLDVVDDHPIAEGLTEESYVYFVHSYYADAGENAVARTRYGDGDDVVSFASVVANDAGNVVGTQFHPEKSGTVGLRLLENFVDWVDAY